MGCPGSGGRGPKEGPQVLNRLELEAVKEKVHNLEGGQCELSEEVEGIAPNE